MTTINVNKVPYAIMFHHFHPDGEQPAAQGSTTPGDLRKNIEYIEWKTFCRHIFGRKKPLAIL